MEHRLWCWTRTSNEGASGLERSSTSYLFLFSRVQFKFPAYVVQASGEWEGGGGGGVAHLYKLVSYISISGYSVIVLVFAPASLKSVGYFY